MDILIREAKKEDSKSIFKLVVDFATSFEPCESSFCKSFAKIICDKAAFIVVAVYEFEIVGYCLAFDHHTFYANGRVSWVEEIMVRDSLRRNGIGALLMKSVEEWGITRESKLVGLATRRASSFYEAIGYEESAIFYGKLL